MHSDGTIIQIAVSLSSAEQLKMDEIGDADAVEIRLDLMPDLGVEAVADLAESFPGQIILTLRSREEGGAFTGDVDEWMERVRPFLPYVTAVDLEIRYQAHARALKEAGKNIIASCHRNEMLTGKELETLHSELRSFGDIPKIAVYPHDSGELLSLLQYTHMAPKPVIVSVTGTICRYARPLLPLFGSLYTYCYIDTPTSPGQYSLREMRTLGQLLAPGMIDTWFDGKTPGQMES